MTRKTSHPIIVLEGADAAGKTTLAQALVDKFHFKYVHMTYRFPKMMHVYQAAALELCLRLSEHHPVVLDRWALSDVIYGTEFRGKPSDPYSRLQLDRVAQRYGILQVFCCPSDVETQRDRHGRRRGDGGEMYDTLGQLPERYLAEFDRVKHRDDVLRYDVDEWPMERLAEAAANVYNMGSVVRADTAIGHPVNNYDLLDRRWCGHPRSKSVVLVPSNYPKPQRLWWPCSWYEPSFSELDDAFDTVHGEPVMFVWEWARHDLEETGLFDEKAVLTRA